MIKPFEVLSTIDEDGGYIGVVYKLTKVVVSVNGMQASGTPGEYWENTQRKEETLTAYVRLPADADVDKEVFTIAKKDGWIQ